MKTQNVTSTPVAFSALKRDPDCISRAMFNAIKEAPAVKKFGEKYNATVSCDLFASSKDTKKIQMALTLKNIEPVSIKDKLLNIFGKKKSDSIQLKTHALNEEDFIKSVSRKKSDTLFDIYNE